MLKFSYFLDTTWKTVGGREDSSFSVAYFAEGVLHALVLLCNFIDKIFIIIITLMLY